MAKYKELKINLTVTPEMVLKQLAKRLQTNVEPAQTEKTDNTDSETKK